MQKTGKFTKKPVLQFVVKAAVITRKREKTHNTRRTKD